jgi:glycosyltransferase involved in cell wall biosynthesis
MDRPMTIAHILMSLGAGGQERVALHLTEAAIRARHRVIVVALSPAAPKDLSAEFTRAGADVHHVPKRGGSGLDPFLSMRLGRLLFTLAVDIVHTHNPLPLVYAPLAARACGAGVIHTKHGANPSGAGNLMLRRASALLVDFFVAVSRTTAEQARRRHECAPAKIVVIANGVPLDRFAPDPVARAATRAAHGIPEDAFVIGAVGRVDENKNHAYLVRAALPLLGPRVHLLIVGDGAAMPAVRAATSGPGAEFVHLAGWSADVPGALAAMDVLAMSSRSEGLPLVIPEAMACGLPVVSTAVGGIPDVIDDGATGFLVPPGESEAALRAPLATLCIDPARARSMGELARREALARYGVTRMSDAYADLYRRACRKQ